MKVRITFKDPDAVEDGLDDAFKALPKPDGLTDAEWKDIKDARRQDTSLLPFIQWGEYCTVEIDTEAKTATVVQVKD